jgi:hypothetical protein
MAADVMRSCLVLVEDLLDVLPVLLYQVGGGGPQHMFYAVVSGRV